MVENLYRGVVSRNIPPRTNKATHLIVVYFDRNSLVVRCLYVFQRSSRLTSPFLVIESSYSSLLMIPHKIQLKSTGFTKRAVSASLGCEELGSSLMFSKALTSSKRIVISLVLKKNVLVRGFWWVAAASSQ